MSGEILRLSSFDYYRGASNGAWQREDSTYRYSEVEWSQDLCDTSSYTPVGGIAPMEGASEGASKAEVTLLLRAWVDGDQGALDRLTPMVERELHRLAHRYMNQERPDHTLQTTALVNEVYIRLLDVPQISWQDRAHFFAMSARMMRHILTDFARSRNYQKRGGDAVHVTLEDNIAAIPGQSVDVVALDRALTHLAVSYPRQSQVVELRFFGGLSVKETAEVLKIPTETVKRDWKFAKVWLLRALTATKDYVS